MDDSRNGGPPLGCSGPIFRIPHRHDRQPQVPAVWRRVILESPYQGDLMLNEFYATLAARDCLFHGEAPFLSHVLYAASGILDDDDALERDMGIAAGLAWGAQAEASVVYTDLGISPGMQRGIDTANALKRPVEFRTLQGWSELLDSFELQRAQHALG